MVAKQQIKTKKEKQPQTIKKNIKKMGIPNQEDMNDQTQPIDTNQNETDTNQMIKKIHKSIPQQFQVHRGILPIYSGGKIQFLSKSTNGVGIYSTYNYATKVSQYHEGAFETSDTITHRDEELCNFVVSNDGTRIVTFTKNHLLRYCSMENPIKIHWTQKIEPLFPIDMAMSPEDIFVALGSTNGQVRIINVKKGTTSNEYRFHQGSVLKVAWNPIMRKLQLVSAGDDQKIIVFDVVSNRITSLSFLGGGAQLLSTSSDQLAKVWDLAQYKLKDQAKFEMDIEAGCSFVIKKKEYFVVGSLDGKIFMGDPNGLEVAQQFDFLEGQEILKISQPDSRVPQLFVVTGELHVYIVNFLKSQNKWELNVEQCILGYNDEVLDVRFEQRTDNWIRLFDYDNEYVVMATNSPFLKLVELKTMKVKAWKAHDDIVMTVQFMERHILSGAKDNAIKLWRVLNNQPQLMCTYVGHSDNVIGVTFSYKDMALIASVSSDKTLKIWDSQKLIKKTFIDSPIEISQSLRSVSAHEKDINCVKFSPNSKLVATSSQDRLIKLWDSGTLMLTMTLKGHKRGVWDVQFSPVDKVLVSASGDCTLKVWSLLDGQIVHNLEGHTGSILKVSYLCFGLMLLSSDVNGVMKLWNVKKQVCSSTFEKHDGKMWALDVSPYTAEGKVYLASGGNDSVFHIWKDTTEEENLENQKLAHEKQLKTQQYQNFVREGRWKEAALLAFECNFTSHFIKAVGELLNCPDTKDLDDLAQELISNHTIRFMTLMNQLNLSKKTCSTSQNLFYRSIRLVHINTILSKLENDQKNTLKKLILSYRSSTQRIQTRVKAMKKQTHIVEFLLSKNNILTDK